MGQTKRTNRQGWGNSVTVDAERGYLKIHTRWDDAYFEGEGAFGLACKQAKALADFYPGSGRFLVRALDLKGDKARVYYDEAQQRHGVKQEHQSEARQHANSGTMTWSEARTFEI